MKELKIVELQHSCVLGCDRKSIQSLMKPSGRHNRGIDHADGIADYRLVLVFRNLYEALISGYLYHKSGRECWLADDGSRAKEIGTRFTKRVWHDVLSYNSKPQRIERQLLCSYLNDVSEEQGIRAYTDAVFRSYYHLLLKLWATAQATPSVRERTTNICYEDLASHDAVSETREKILDFMYSKGRPARLKHIPMTVENESSKTAGGHGTSHDPSLRQHLTKIIKELDTKYYNGEIAWLSSVLPCQLQR